MSEEVKLTLVEISIAAHVGCIRQLQSLKRGLKDKHGMDPKDGWGIHIEGACGELAVAKFLDLHWDGSVGVFHEAADVGQFHVRTRSRDYYDLLIRDDDPDDGIFILVTGFAPNYTIRGWQYGSICKSSKYQKKHGNRKPAYFYPQNELRDMTTLKSDSLEKAQ